MKIQRCNYISEGEITIIKDMDTLIHNLVTPELKELQQENKQLKEQLEYLRSNEYLNQVKWERNFNEELVKDLQQKIDKAIELAKIRIESCNAGLSNAETSIVSKHSLLRLEIQSYKELLEILGDKE